jgi:hypothetical protein
VRTERRCLRSRPRMFAGRYTYRIESQHCGMHTNVAATRGRCLQYVGSLFFWAAVPDFLSLWKTRLLLETLTRRSAFVSRSWPIVLLDACLSVGVYFTFWYLLTAFLDILRMLLGEESPSPSNDYCYEVVFGGSITLWKIALGSTLFTTVWTMLILLSKSILQLLAPIHMFTSWFFDLDKHPL